MVRQSHLGTKIGTNPDSCTGKEFWNIPSRLADRLRGKHAEKTVAGVSLGYEDQYNVRFTGRERGLNSSDQELKKC